MKQTKTIQGCNLGQWVSKTMLELMKPWKWNGKKNLVIEKVISRRNM